MFNKQELAVIHKALAEYTIKGVDAPAMATLLKKVFDAHNSINEQDEASNK